MVDPVDQAYQRSTAAKLLTSGTLPPSRQADPSQPAILTTLATTAKRAAIRIAQLKLTSTTVVCELAEEDARDCARPKIEMDAVCFRPRMIDFLRTATSFQVGR